MKSCELCTSSARLYCDSDQASLCWSCDSKVHGANFLVARHSRNLLCQVCHSPTPWSCSGARLCPSASVCVECSAFCGGLSEDSGGNRDEIGDGDEESEVYSDEEEEDGDVEEEEEDEEDFHEEDGDYQVVPRSSTTMSTPPPPATSSSCSSSSEESCNGDGDRDRSTPLFMKRARETCPDLSLQDSPRHWSSIVENRDAAVGGETTEKEIVDGDETNPVNGRSLKPGNGVNRTAKFSRRDEDLET